MTINEPYFQGHFPDEQVMPGVLLVEAMAQTGDCLFSASWKGNIPPISSASTMSNSEKVVPGDTLIFKLELTSPIRRGIANMRGLCFVGDKVVAEGEFMAQIVKNY